MIQVPTSPLAHPIFDVAAWLAGIGMSIILYRWRLKGLAEQVASKVGAGYFVALALGAIPGAWFAGSINTLNRTSPTLSHSIAGALVGAIIGVEIYKAARGVKGSTGGLFVGSFALGVVIGRLGCFFAGLPDFTFGTPTGLPWAVDLGDRVGRHPVQLYESLAMAAFLIVYLVGLDRRQAWAMRRGFYVMCLWYGLQRFAWEFLKPYPRLFGPFNVFQFLCAGLVVYGCVYFLADWRRELGAQDRPLPVPRPDHQPV